jgi:hypothetical protein
MTARSPTATLDAGWDSLLGAEAGSAGPLPASAVEALADIAYFHTQGLEADAATMLEALRDRYPGHPRLATPPWEAAATSGPADPADEPEAWTPDEHDILEALDLLDRYDETRDGGLRSANASEDPATPIPAHSAGIPDNVIDFHEAITVVEPIPVTSPPADPPRAEHDTGIWQTAPGSADRLLRDVDDPRLAAVWFDEALTVLRALEGSVSPPPLADEWDVDLEDDDEWDDDFEIDVDTAELEPPAPAVVETLAYLPRDLAAIRQPTVHDTLPYGDDDVPRSLMLIRGGG